MIPGASAMMLAGQAGPAEPAPPVIDWNLLYDAWQVQITEVASSGGQLYSGAHAGNRYAIGAWLSLDTAPDSDWHTYHTGTVTSSAHSWVGVANGVVTNRTTSVYTPYVLRANVSAANPAWLQGSFSQNRPRPGIIVINRWASEVAWRILALKVRMRRNGSWFRVADRVWDAGDNTDPNTLFTYAPVAE